MKICLKNTAQQNGLQQAVIQLQERLPEHIHAPSELTCTFHAINYKNYYLLTLDVVGVLMVTCQRCLKTFQYDYCTQIKIAACASDTIAERLMEDYECIVMEENEVDLSEILTDELHLFSREKHENSADCDIEIRQWIGDKNENMPVTLGL
jgi:uncharacterized protein